MYNDENYRVFLHKVISGLHQKAKAKALVPIILKLIFGKYL